VDYSLLSLAQRRQSRRVWLRHLFDSFFIIDLPEASLKYSIFIRKYSNGKGRYDKRNRAINNTFE
jgi:hypothetical protein